MKKSAMMAALCGLFLGLGAHGAEQVYTIDRSHSTIGFAIRHMVVSKTRGTFDEYDGTLTTKDGKLAAAEAVITVASIDTKDKKRDDHLRNEDFFDVAKHAEMSFKATAITGGTITGELTMVGVTKTIDLTYTLKGPINDPWGNQRIGIEAEGKINRKDWGLTYNSLLEGGGMALGEEVELQISLEGIKKAK